MRSFSLLLALLCAVAGKDSRDLQETECTLDAYNSGDCDLEALCAATTDIGEDTIRCDGPPNAVKITRFFDERCFGTLTSTKKLAENATLPEAGYCQNRTEVWKFAGDDLISMIETSTITRPFEIVKVTDMPGGDCSDGGTTSMWGRCLRNTCGTTTLNNQACSDTSCLICLDGRKTADCSNIDSRLVESCDAPFANLTVPFFQAESSSSISLFMIWSLVLGMTM